MKAANTKKTLKKTTSKTARKNVLPYKREGGFSTREDFKTAALVVSVLINLSVFVGWLTLQATTEFDLQIARLLFS